VKRHDSLAAWRRSHGWNQRQAAGFLGISQTYYSRLERYQQAPRRALAKSLTTQTGVSLADLMGMSL
jgi:transcriptional regulator with XRE-family HTH domain